MDIALEIFVIFLAVLCMGYCIINPRIAIVPVLWLFPVQQIIQGYMPEIVNRYQWMVNIVVGLIALFGATYSFFRERNSLRGMNNSSFIAALALFGYMFCAILWTPSQDSVAFFLVKSWPYFFLSYIIAPLLVKDVEDLKRICFPLIVSGAAIMVLMLVNPRARFVDDRFTIDLGYVIGMGTLRSNPLAIADAGGMLAIVAAVYRPARANLFTNGVKAAAVLLGLTLALLSGSRGQVLASVGVIAVLLPFASGTSSPLRVAGSLIIVGVVVGFLYFIFTTFTISAAQDRWTGHGSAEGLGQRMEMAQYLLSAYMSHPVYWPVGLGAGSFNEYYPIRAPDNPHWYPHNIMVECLAEYGLPGITLFFLIVWLMARNSFRLYKLMGDDKSRKSAVVAFAGLALFQLFMSLKQGSMLNMPSVFMFTIILGRVAKNEETAAAALYVPLDEKQEALDEYGELDGEEPLPEPA